MQRYLGEDRRDRVERVGLVRFGGAFFGTSAMAVELSKRRARRADSPRRAMAVAVAGVLLRRSRIAVDTICRERCFANDTAMRGRTLYVWGRVEREKSSSKIRKCW